MMSEVYMKGKLVLEAIKKDKKMSRSDELKSRLEQLEAEMDTYNKQFNESMPR